MIGHAVKHVIVQAWAKWKLFLVVMIAMIAFLSV